MAYNGAMTTPPEVFVHPTATVDDGAYVGVGSFDRIGDAGEMLKNGSPLWLLWLFGAIALPLGLFLWNGLGPSFGLGRAAGKVDHRVAWVSCGLLVLTLGLEIALSVMSAQ